MLHLPVYATSPRNERYVRIVVASILALLAICAFSAHLLLQTKIVALQSTHTNEAVGNIAVHEEDPFPVSVNPHAKQFVYTNEQETMIQIYAAPFISSRQQDRWFDQLLARLGTQNWFQNIATPQSRILVILPGERQEQIADNIGNVLGWSDTEQETFITEIKTNQPAFQEGTFMPGRYVVPRNAAPSYVANLVTDRFQRLILARYPIDIEQTIPMVNALTLASLLERESYHFSEMRVIAGIIWNRLFQDMHLQIDATLQYAKVNAGLAGTTWWPQPLPEDKFIDSPFNTYQNTGLPPSPIANPSVASVIAALNPLPTDCLFYFHDRHGGFHCSETYEGHVQGLRIHYGQGR